MDKEKEINQLAEDMEKILGLIEKMENSSLEDLDTLKKESILIEEEFKKRYGKSDSPQTDSQEA
jgi:Asp-tRNA(Asn)/Glu-tRNA(Gln) amidotransferase C subunit